RLGERDAVLAEPERALPRTGLEVEADQREDQHREAGGRERRAEQHLATARQHRRRGGGRDQAHDDASSDSAASSGYGDSTVVGTAAGSDHSRVPPRPHGSWSRSSPRLTPRRAFSPPASVPSVARARRAAPSIEITAN